MDDKGVTVSTNGVVHFPDRRRRATYTRVRDRNYHNSLAKAVLVHCILTGEGLVLTLT